MAYVLQGRNDCAIVSICNFTGKSYDEVLEAGKVLNPTFPDKVRMRGTSHDEIMFILAYLTKRVWTERKPRRGQEKLTGLCSWHVAGRRQGHLTACISGHVYDTDGSIYPIEEYRARFNYSLRKVWC